MISWIRRNKLASILILVVGYFLYKQYFGGIRPLPNYRSIAPSFKDIGRESFKIGSTPSSPADEVAPTIQTSRMVVQESNLSLVVKDVRESTNKAIEYVNRVGGYMVSSSFSQPKEAPYAYLVLRVPAKNLQVAVDFFRSLAIKVSSENLLGTDVTDQYTDLEARLSTLNKTKAKFEEIMAKAEKVPEILEVQRELINLQNQIDNIKGQQQYLEKTTELAKISLHLSTDEYSLPYTPSETFRPKVIFKQAVRALIKTIRWLLKVLIWVIVFIPIWGGVVLVWYWRHRRKQVSSLKKS